MIRRSTWVVLVVFALLVAVVVFWQRSQENQPDEEPTATVANTTLLDADADIVGMRLEKVGEGIVELQRDDQNIWQLTWPAGQEADVSAVESAVTQLLALRTLATMQQVPELSAIGLDPPAYRILLTLSDGRQVRIAVGGATPTGSGYYVQVSGRPLYIVSTYGMDAFLELVNSPPIQPTPTPGLESVPEVAPATATP